MYFASVSQSAMHSELFWWSKGMWEIPKRLEDQIDEAKILLFENISECWIIVITVNRSMNESAEMLLAVRQRVR